MDRVLKKLDPEERAHQACSLRGLDAIRKGSHLKGIDRIKTSSRSHATFKNNVVTANGGAVRAHHHWYSLKYTCTVTADQMRATSFNYKLGPEIPEDEWENYGLWK
jgi:predicted outer membrane repeat protein